MDVTDSTPATAASNAERVRTVWTDPSGQTIAIDNGWRCAHCGDEYKSRLQAERCLCGSDEVSDSVIGYIGDDGTAYAADEVPDA